MANQLYFSEVSDACNTELFRFFGSDNLMLLFYSLYYKVKKTIPDVIIRGIPNNTFGVSRQYERCIFYVKKGNDSCLCYFRGIFNGIPFIRDNAEKLSDFTFRGIQRHEINERDYQIGNFQFEEASESEKSQEGDNFCSDQSAVSDNIKESTITDDDKGKLLNKIEKTETVKPNMPELPPDMKKQKEIIIPGRITKYDLMNSIPFFKLYDVDPDNYNSIEISENLFSPRVCNALLRSGINTLGQLLNFSSSRLRYNVKNIGRASVREIIKLFDAIIGQRKKYPEPKRFSDYIINDRTIRSEFHRWLMTVKAMECSKTVEIESCEDFYNWIQKWTSEFYLNFTGWEERDIEIYIRRTVNGENPESIAKMYSIPSERVRQINSKFIEKITNRVTQRPTKPSADKIIELVEFMESFDENEIIVHLNYVMQKNQTLLNQILSFFFTEDELNELLRSIVNSPKAGNPEKKNKTETPVYIPPFPTGKKCPQCGSDQVIYTIAKGSNPGYVFVACSKYPRCGYRRHLSWDEINMLKENLPDQQ